MADFGQMREGRQITGARVTIELDTSWLRAEYFNKNSTVPPHHKSQAEFDVDTLKKKLPTLLAALDLHGDFQVSTQFDYEEAHG